MTVPPRGSRRPSEPVTALVSRPVLEELDEDLHRVAARGGRLIEVVVFDADRPPTAEEHESIEVAFYSRDLWEGCDKTRITKPTKVFFETIDTAPRLRWLHVTSAGADLPMYLPSIERGVRLSTSSGGNAAPIAQTALVGLLGLARGLGHWLDAQRRREWRPLRPPALPRDVMGQTATLVGTGPIGRELARLLKAVGMRTVGVRQRAQATENFDAVHTFNQLDGLLPETDWLVLCCPLTDTTRGLIDAHRIGQLPAGAGIVNIARGEIVEEHALIEALRTRRLSGAYLDVFEVEPLPAGSPLWDMPNVIVTPHNCSASAGNFGRGVQIFARNLERYLRGEALENEQTPATVGIRTAAPGAAET